MKCKSVLRRAVLARRRALPSQEIRRRSGEVGSLLSALPEFAAARLVMFFVSFGSEVDTGEMMRGALAAGKRVAAPRAETGMRRLVPYEVRDPEEDLAPGAHGIREPRSHCAQVELEEIDVVLVPAAVWAEDGYRIGYGAGYYDRFLGRVERAVRVGLGLEIQVVPEVPHDSHDLPVDVLVTEAGVRRLGRRAAGARPDEGGEQWRET